jgi:outer membrane protein OmpA-like peptidoglycan-associated protein
LQLSKRRAESVKNYLVQNGIDGKRIVTEYYSYSIPAGYTTKVDERTIKASNSTVEQRARNRRAEVTTVIK